MYRSWKRRKQWPAVDIVSGRLLDVGCGNQNLRAQLHNRVEYIGLDYPATTGLGYAGKPHILADGQQLPFADKTFDSVCLLDVLEHIPQPEKAFSEAVRVTRHQGKIYWQTPFIYPIHDLPYDFYRWTIQGIQQHENRYPVILTELTPHSNAIETAVTLTNLALAKGILDAFTQRHIKVLLAPIGAMLILFNNLSGRLLASVFQDVGFMPLGYSAVFSKNMPENGSGSKSSECVRLSRNRSGKHTQ